MKNRNLCPTCHQDLRALPHKGVNDKNCPQCGQGINWKAALNDSKILRGLKERKRRINMISKEYLYCCDCDILWPIDTYKKCPLCQIKDKKVIKIFSDGEVLFQDKTTEVFPMDHEGIKRYFGIGDILISTSCLKCHQVDRGQTGEYPCDVCGLPLVHD